MTHRLRWRTPASRGGRTPRRREATLHGRPRGRHSRCAALHGVALAASTGNLWTNALV
ncbi:hypothetical protein ACP70R_049814 [Stipagrostis hirtigluma subsp. patula]